MAPSGGPAKRTLSAIYLTLIGMLMLMATGCVTYTFNGAVLDYNVYKTVYIGEFPIRAALVYAPLQQTFELELSDYVSRNTRLQVLDNAKADLRIEGEITGYNLTPQAVTEDAYASKTRLTITVRVKYSDTLNPHNDLDQTFSAYRDFDATELLIDVQEQLCQEISKELVQLIFNATLGNW